MLLRPVTLGLCVLFATMSGCAGLGLTQTGFKTELSKTGEPKPDGIRSAKVDVIFQPDRGQAERLERSLSEPATVQQMLVQTGAIKKYRRIEVEVIRPLPNGGHHKIPCEYDRTTKQIDPANDIALMPGDSLIVKEDTSTIIDDMMKSAGGSLGKRFSTGGKHKPESRYRVER